MNNNDSRPTPFTSLSEKNNFVIILNQNPTFSEVCSAVSLKKVLEKNGKSANVLCSIKVNYSNILGVENISSTFVSSGNNLVVSFPYTEGSIDKVSYQIENDYFNLLITPQPGSQKLDVSKVKFNYSGEDFDAIVIINTIEKQKLGNIYFQNVSKFDGKQLVNINSSAETSICESIINIVKKFNFEIDRDAASNLYNGILYETNNFSRPNISADTFEMCGFLLRHGAQKFVDKQMNGAPKMKAVEAREIGQNEDEKDWLKPNIFRGGKLV